LRRHDGDGLTRLRMIENGATATPAAGDDYWIEDEWGDRRYRVDEPAAQMRGRFVLRAPDGSELARLEARNSPGRRAVVVQRQGDTIATVHEDRGLHHHFRIAVADGPDLDADGHVAGYEYEIRRGEDVVATVSRRWFGERDTYGIETRDGEDEPLLLAVTVALDELSRP
jgi:uncharacterized protein YxjI